MLLWSFSTFQWYSSNHSNRPYEITSNNLSHLFVRPYITTNRYPNTDANLNTRICTNHDTNFRYCVANSNWNYHFGALDPGIHVCTHRRANKSTHCCSNSITNYWYCSANVRDCFADSRYSVAHNFPHFNSDCSNSSTNRRNCFTN